MGAGLGKERQPVTQIDVATSFLPGISAARASMSLSTIADQAPLRLRRIDAMTLARSRLTHAYCATCLLPSGDEAELLLRLDVSPPVGACEGLTLSTRFGPAVAFEYGPLLLACSGVDLDGATEPGVRVALARYGFAALAPSLQAALGEPTPSNAPIGEPTIAVHMRLRLPSIRLTMRWRATAAGILALLDSGAWRRVDAPRSIPAWLAEANAALPLLAGATTLSLADFRALRQGDVVRVAASRFDVTGRAIVRFAGRRLHLCWLDAQRCFEVQTMSDDTPFRDSDTHTCTDTDTHAGIETDLPPPGAPPSIDTSAIPVRLSFSLGVLSLTVGEVSQLAAGALLPLDRGLPPRVEIEANGLPIGAGELVDLDGRLAVEITQWPHDGGQSRS